MQPPKVIGITEEPDPAEQGKGKAEDFTLRVAAGCPCPHGRATSAPPQGVTLIPPRTFQKDSQNDWSPLQGLLAQQTSTCGERQKLALMLCG